VAGKETFQECDLWPRS